MLFLKKNAVQNFLNDFIYAIYPKAHLREYGG